MTFADTRRQLSNHLTHAITGIYRGLDSWQVEDVIRFQAQALPVLHGAQRILGAAVSAYIAGEVVRQHDRHIAPPPVGELTDLRQGVTDAEVYHRPFVQTWYRLSKGEPLAAAVIAGATRAGQIAELDMQQTYAHAVRAAMNGVPRPLRPTSWRRLVTGTEGCELCRRAASRLYSLDELNPSHGNCYCTVVPTWGGKPGTGADDVVAVHGELGPVLVRPQDRFSSEGDLQK